MKGLALWLVIFLLQDVVPYKPKEEFEIKLDYKFKQRPTSEKSTVHLDETRAEYDRRTSTDLLPYLILNVRLIKLNNESRLRISNNLNQKIYSKKVEEGSIIPIDLGFTVDVKDGINANEYILTFLSPEKNEVTKITILIEKDGSFLVNGEKRGRF